MTQWIVYILRCADGSLYSGITTDLAARVEKHNTGSGAKYTRSRLPVACVWQEAAETESAARKREASLKQLPKDKKEQLVH